MADPLRNPQSDWIARMRETPNLARNTVFIEEAVGPPPPKPRGGGRAGAPPSGVREGDWQCPECPNINFARRDECHRCGASKPYEPKKPRARQLRDSEEPRRRQLRDSEEPRRRPRDSERRRPEPRDRDDRERRRRSRSRSRSRGGQNSARGRGGVFPDPKDGNWKCGGCQNDNWSWRRVCNRCNKPRPENLAPRTGRQGGFNEREDAALRRAPPPDEDDGFDDFGRRKKAKKSKAEREAEALARLQCGPQ